MPLPLARLLVIVALTATATACGAAPARPRVIDPLAGESKSGGALIDVPSAASNTSIVATAVVPTLAVFADPADDAEQIHELSNPIPSGGPLIFLVEASVEGWLQVLLPLRPNGSMGWVRFDDVALATHDYRIEISLSDFDLKVFNGDRLRFQTAVAVAADNAPTPGGRYYITELITPEIPDTIYGNFAYGLSGYSETFETFNGGPGQLGIHGTNDPDRIGFGVSSGCVRLANGDIAKLTEFLPLGTPVTVIG